MCLSIGMNLLLYKSEANLDREDDRFHLKSIESKNTFYHYYSIRLNKNAWFRSDSPNPWSPHAATVVETVKRTNASIEIFMVLKTG